MLINFKQTDPEKPTYSMSGYCKQSGRKDLETFK